MGVRTVRRDTSSKEPLHMSGVGPRTANTFSSAPAPSNYVAGVGRGAMGFTTRSDIGPAKAPTMDITLGLPVVPSPSPFFVPQFGAAPAGYVAGRGRGMGELARDQKEVIVKPSADDADRGDYSESNFDEFSGYTEKLFVGTPYEDDDMEADRIYEGVDELMDSRRKRQRELQMLEAKKKNKEDRGSIADQFADLKRELANVSVTEWEAIPDVGDHSLKFKQKRRNEIFTPLPDFLIGDQKGIVQSIDPNAANGTKSTITGLAEARGTVLSLKLDKMSDSVTGQTVVDPKGYLTDLNSLKITSDAEIGDIEKARTLLGSVTATNPKHGPGWIAAARVEEYAGKLVQARKIIRQGCDSCPDNEDVWLEAARLHSKENAKPILANAVRHVPNSVKVWIAASDLEEEDAKKKIVLRRALESIPNSVKLWRTLIELENVSDARIMLARAVECIPTATEFWLALARLESYDNARKVLNQAREAIPTEPAIWITAAKLEEAHGNVAVVDRIIEKTLVSLSQYQVVINREFWLKEAEACEAAGSPLTCGAIVRSVLHIGVDEEDRKRVWMDDAEACLQKHPPSVVTAKAIYQHALSIYPTKKTIWMAAAALEKEHGTRESLEKLLGEAVKSCPTSEVLWLMAAKEKWLAGDVQGARTFLVEAFEKNSSSEQIWLAAVKLEWENDEIQRARLLLSKARMRAPTERVWLKSALLEREVRDATAVLALLDEAIVLYPSFAKYYMMAGQTCIDLLSDQSRARVYYHNGLKNCPSSVPLWIMLAKLEEETKGIIKARSVIETARLKVPRNDELWLQSVRFERRIPGNEKLADALMARALQECPDSGLLWSEELAYCSKPQRKSKSIDALKRCENNAMVVTAVGRLFEKDRKTDKARKFYDRAVMLEPRLGDSWAYYYAFELRQSRSIKPGETGSTANAESVLARCVAAEPNRGELWCAVSKLTEYRRKDIATVLKKVAENVLSMGASTLMQDSGKGAEADMDA